MDMNVNDNMTGVETTVQPADMDSLNNSHEADIFSSQHLLNSSQNTDMDSSQQLLNNTVTRLIEQQQRTISALLLPTPQLPVFNGDVMNYHTFMMAFDVRVVPYVTSSVDKLYYLDQQLHGEPKELIGGCIYMAPGDGYSTARKLLDAEYGDHFKVSMAYLNKALSWPPIQPDDGQTLKRFSFYLTKCLHVMRNIAYMDVLNHIPYLQRILSKLPMDFQDKWRDHVAEMRLTGQNIQFEDLVDFVHEASNIVNDPAFGKEAMNSVEPTFNTKMAKNAQHMEYSFSAQIISVDKCPMCQNEHDLESCEQFLSVTLNERRRFLRNQMLCFGCYGVNHVSKNCNSKRLCSICQKPHPTAMHSNNFNMFSAMKQDIKWENSIKSQDILEQSNHTENDGSNLTQDSTECIFVTTNVPKVRVTDFEGKVQKPMKCQDERNELLKKLAEERKDEKDKPQKEKQDESVRNTPTDERCRPKDKLLENIASDPNEKEDSVITTMTEHQEEHSVADKTRKDRDTVEQCTVDKPADDNSKANKLTEENATGDRRTGENPIDDKPKEDESKKDDPKQDIEKEDEAKEDKANEDKAKKDESKQDKANEDDSKDHKAEKDEAKEDEAKEDENEGGQTH